jgi:isopenicillin-N epimerase
MSPANVVSRLRQSGIVATTTPYAPSYARLTPSIRNTPAEIDLALDAIRALR